MHSQFIKYRYIIPKEEKNVVNYAEALNKVFETTQAIDTLDDVLEVINKLNALGVYRIAEHASAIVKEEEVLIDNKTVKVKKLLIENKELFEALYSFKRNLINSLKTSNYKLSQMSKLLYFYRFSYKEDLTEEEIQKVFEQRNTMTFVKTEEKVNETRVEFDFEHHEKVSKNTKTLSSYFTFTSDNFVYKNQFGEKFKRFDFKNKKVDDTIYPIYVPILVKSTYRVNRRTFIHTNEYVSFKEGKGINISFFVQQTINYFKALTLYKFEDLSTAAEIVQQKILTIFYEKQSFLPSDEDYINTYARTMDYDDYKEKYTYELNVFKDVTDLTSLEARAEFFKVHFRDFPNYSINGSEIETRWGKQGFNKKLHFPLKEIDTNLFDPTFVSTTGEFLFTYTDKDRTPMALILSEWNKYNKVSIRNSMGSYTTLKALELKRHDDPLTTNGFKSRFFKDIPTITLWMLNEELKTEDGFSTTEGMRIIDPEVAKTYGIYTGMKLATKDLNKGVVSISNTDRYYFIHEGKKIYLSVMSPKDMFSRLNFGSFIESLYNGKKYLNGETKQEIRNLTDNPIKASELLDLQEVYKETKHEVVSLGKKSVSLWTLHYVHETDTTFDELEDSNKDATFTIGVEAIQRMFLEGSKELAELFIKSDEKRLEIEKAMLDKYPIQQLYGKYGKVTSLYKYKGLGFNSTVVGNSNLGFDEKHLYLVEKDIPNLIRVFKSFFKKQPKEFENIKQKLMNKESFTLPSDILVRNPSIDRGNFIPGRTKLFYADERFNVSILMVNPSAWARQGGDFDGDQGYIMFLKPHIFKAINEVYTLSSYEIKNIDTFDIPKYETLQDFVNVYAKLKGKPTRTVENILTPKTQEKLVNAARLDVVVAFIGKQSVGVAKSVTMRMLAFITAYMNENKFYPNVAKRLIELANETNGVLVQKTIDIAKWADNIEKVKETVVLASTKNMQVVKVINQRLFVNAVDKMLAVCYFDPKVNAFVRSKDKDIEKHLLEIVESIKV